MVPPKLARNPSHGVNELAAFRWNYRCFHSFEIDQDTEFGIHIVGPSEPRAFHAEAISLSPVMKSPKFSGIFDDNCHQHRPVNP